MDCVDFCRFYWKLDVRYREMCQIHETVNKKQLWGICHPSPRSHPSPRKWCQQVLLRPSLPHAPGVRMTGVKQTPSKFPKQIYLNGVLTVLPSSLDLLKLVPGASPRAAAELSSRRSRQPGEPLQITYIGESPKNSRLSPKEEPFSKI